MAYFLKHMPILRKDVGLGMESNVDRGSFHSYHKKCVFHFLSAKNRVFVEQLPERQFSSEHRTRFGTPDHAAAAPRCRDLLEDIIKAASEWADVLECEVARYYR
jgi:hypothetical protein